MASPSPDRCPPEPPDHETRARHAEAWGVHTSDLERAATKRVTRSLMADKVIFFFLCPLILRVFSPLRLRRGHRPTARGVLSTQRRRSAISLGWPQVQPFRAFQGGSRDRARSSTARPRACPT